MNDKRHQRDTRVTIEQKGDAHLDAFVLDKGIFSNVFDKDIRRVFIYKKAERLAKAIHLIAPAFKDSRALAERIDRIAVGLVDAAVEPPAHAREALARELLALSSVLSIARIGNMLSPMNAELISRESHALLEEIASYEEPRLTLTDSPSLATLARQTQPTESVRTPARVSKRPSLRPLSDRGTTSDRRTAILDVLDKKGPSRIKDISLIVRDVSEKTIQRELQSLVHEGVVKREGERRWTTYALVR